MDESILKSIKKLLGIEDSYTVFDADILMHINSVLSTLNQLAVGPDGGISIAGEEETWDQLFDRNSQSSVKSYIYLRVRLLFDPPTTSFAIDSMQKQIDELAWRLNVQAEQDASDGS